MTKVEAKGEFIKLSRKELILEDEYNFLIEEDMLKCRKEQLLHEVYKQLREMMDRVVRERTIDSAIKGVALEFEAFIKVKPKKKKKGEKEDE